ncbi:GAF domain-containing sensor histidine kinase [Streptosporangium sp. NPDC051022]|uniref:GAF domain-containing sensor histidine kinase n=1 Tax=Streptosporangium sp. NPDC051022 TaxID=3155752 RepID=UPI003426FBF7
MPPAADAVVTALGRMRGAGIVVVDTDRVCVWANDDAATILRVSRENIVGRPWTLPASPIGGPETTVVSNSLELAVLEQGIGESDELGTVILFRDITSERQRERRLAAFTTGIGLVPYSGSLTDTFSSIAHDVVRSSRISACQVVLLDPHDGSRWLAGHAGMPQIPEDYADRLAECQRRGAVLHASFAIKCQAPAIEHHQKHRLMRDPAWEPLWSFLASFDWDTFVTAPLIYQGTVLGALNGFYRQGAQPTFDDVAFFIALTDQVAVALHIAQVLAELHGETTKTERDRIASDLHDSVCQMLYSISLHLGAAELGVNRRDGRGLSKASADIAHSRALVDDALTEMRALIFESRASAVAEVGLIAALRRLADAIHIRSSATVRVFAPAEDIQMRTEVAEQVYRIAQEALNNAVKHARASEITIRLSIVSGVTGPELLVRIEDNGLGMPAESIDGFGLPIMSQRARQIGARLTIEPLATGGTVVRLSTKLDRHAA